MWQCVRLVFILTENIWREVSTSYIACTLLKDGWSHCWVALPRTELSLQFQWWTSLMILRLSTSRLMCSQSILAALTGVCSSRGLASRRERNDVVCLTLLLSGVSTYAVRMHETRIQIQMIKTMPVHGCVVCKLLKWPNNMSATHSLFLNSGIISVVFGCHQLEN